MATFPSLKPSTRTYTPGEYPNTAFKAFNGIENRVRHSNAMLDASLRLTFTGISETKMLSILSHFNTQKGSYTSFDLPANIWSGLTNLTSLTPSGYLWRYASPPVVTDIINGYHTVEVSLVTVPPEGAVVAGFEESVTTSIVSGAVTTSANVAGLTKTVDVTYAAGGGFGDSLLTSGFSISVPASITTGTPTADGAATGMTATVTATFVGGAASTAILDPDFASVVLLLHFNGANNSTTMTDSSSKNLTCTAQNTAKISTASSKFGGSSLRLSTSVSDSVDVAATTDLNFGTGDFTFEYWYQFVSRDNFNYCRIFGHTVYSEASGTFRVKLAGDTQGGNVVGEHILNSPNSASARLVGTRQSVIDGAWHHIAFCRSGSTMRCFMDGVLKESATDNANYNYGSTGGLRVGSRGGGVSEYSSCYIDDVRVTKGVARYTATFTPPTLQFPDA